MNEERSLANQILLFVYPLFYLLMLIATVLFGVYVVRDNPVKLAAIVLFGLYLCYRLVTRVNKLVRACSTEPKKEAEGQDPSSG